MRVRTGRLEWLRSCRGLPCTPGFTDSGSARSVHSLPRPCKLHLLRHCGELHSREHLRHSYLDNPRAIPSIPSALRFRSTASAALPTTTTASADFSLQFAPSPFQAQGEISPGKNALLHCTTAGFTPPCLDHKGFAVSCPLALLGSAFYPVLVHRLAICAPRFLPTLGRPHAVALHFARCDQLTAGLAPAGVRPCWAHMKKGRSAMRYGLWRRCPPGICAMLTSWRRRGSSLRRDSWLRKGSWRRTGCSWPRPWWA